MPEFKVHSDFDLTGDQPQAVDHIVDSILAGNRHQTLMGVTGSGKTFTMAKIIEKIQKPTLIISHNKTLAAQLHGEMKEVFSGERGGILRFLLRLLSAGGVRAVHGYLYREGCGYQRRNR